MKLRRCLRFSPVVFPSTLATAYGIACSSAAATHTNAYSAKMLLLLTFISAITRIGSRVQCMCMCGGGACVMLQLMTSDTDAVQVADDLDIKW